MGMRLFLLQRRVEDLEGVLAIRSCGVLQAKHGLLNKKGARMIGKTLQGGAEEERGLLLPEGYRQEVLVNWLAVP